MSSHTLTTVQETELDLIDFNVGSPVLPRRSSISEINFDPHDLIDSELPLFDPQLYSNNDTIPKPSVDVEDILIDIDDFDRDSLDDNGSDEFLDVCEGVEGDDDHVLGVDNFEVLLVLKNLDDLLNATLDESSNISDCEQTDLNKNQLIDIDIKECLEDLDNYLEAIDTSDNDDSDSTDQRTDEVTSPEGEAYHQELNDEQARVKLRKIEENYWKFLTSGIVNRGYIDYENNGNVTVDDRVICRPSSACAAIDDSCNRKKQRRRPKTISGKHTEVRRSIIRRQSLSDNHNAPNSRISGPDATSPIRNPIEQLPVNCERLVHGAYAPDHPCGTAIVEPQNEQSKSDSSSTTAVLDETETRNNSRNSWLRNSMRRLQQLSLPVVDRTEVVRSGDSEGERAVGVSTEELRPVSAPSSLSSLNRSQVPSFRGRSNVAATRSAQRRPRSSSASSRSRRRESLSSTDTSVLSSVDSNISHNMPPLRGTPEENTENTERNSQPSCRLPQHTTESTEVNRSSEKWPHGINSMLACLSCTLGLFNISRFAILTIHFGANFIFQFILLSLVFGLPLFTLQMCLGQQLGTGVIDMWKISPLFQGVGVALLATQAAIGLYSIIGVSWMLVYFRDSFKTSLNRYRWAEPVYYYRRDAQSFNTSIKVIETVPDYFSSVVLQRYHLQNSTASANIRFQSAFNLAVVWIIVFVSLSKGVRSYGKVMWVFTFIPVIATVLLCGKIMNLMPTEYVGIYFPETSWEEFFLNSRSWLAAAQETFLTWGLLGATTMQITAQNKFKNLLRRDSTLVAALTFFMLITMSLVANTCTHILKSSGYSYYPSSFEQKSSYHFMRHNSNSFPQSILNTPIRYMRHNSYIVGEKVIRPGADNRQESGYQALRLATELLPAIFATVDSEQLTPFWSVLTYLIFILFGIGQQLAIWHCVINGFIAINAKVLKKWQSTITFFSCAVSFVLALPLTTEMGIYVLYFMDYTIGSIWWLAIVLILQIMAVFLIRGRPYSGDTIVTALFNPNSHSCLISWAPPLLSFTWNVVLPVALIVLCIGTFKNGNFREMFIWHHPTFTDYWPLWARQLGSILQLLPILCVPFVAVIQSYRYLNNGPSDILDRIQLLYRPPIGEHMEPTPTATTEQNPAPPPDPPPKYTPPPSYTTATGAGLIKILRQSIRRSTRRIAHLLGERNLQSTSRQRPPLQNVTEPPPPDYSSVSIEMNAASSTTSTPTRVSTLERLRSLQSSPNALTAADVASILRSSFRRSRIRSPARNLPAGSNDRFPDTAGVCSSAEFLVETAAPIGETSLVVEQEGRS
ncbi:sodium-dependent transporter bedraggled isoform X2 [Anthonomus grandis grandis]|uniref:sodium-dependent transporter bedraggled isoform X2 n=1 Tax=Anthonomus grandis grandis TaxID=2921223 RepID=UPI0021666DA8|nr:sodium-dependent transporter bedraggled isoform X2 [Anthonomus grandis grandis]